MFRKLILSALCIFAAVSITAAPKIKINQKQKEAVVDTFVRAIIENDAEAMWAILDPELRKVMIEESGSEKQAIKDIQADFSFQKNQRRQLEAIYKDKDKRKEKIDTFVKENDKWFVQKSGKWYINPLKE